MPTLTQELAEIIRTAAQPIAPAARGRFYEAVDRALRDEGELGVGSVRRACARAQAEFLNAPPLDARPPPALRSPYQRRAR